MSGAGIPGGQIVGATDAKGFYASDNVYSPEDFASSLYTKMGIDPRQTLYQSTGRPVRLVNGGSPIKELFTWAADYRLRKKPSPEFLRNL